MLVYYGMLNLVECFLAASRVPLETLMEHHGLTLPMGSTTAVRVPGSPAARSVSIVHEFARLMGTPVQGANEYAVRTETAVVLPSPFDQHLGFLQRVEDLPVEQLVAKLPVERLYVAALP